MRVHRLAFVWGMALSVLQPCASRAQTVHRTPQEPPVRIELECDIALVILSGSSLALGDVRSAQELLTKEGARVIGILPPRVVLIRLARSDPKSLSRLSMVEAVYSEVIPETACLPYNAVTQRALRIWNALLRQQIGGGSNWDARMDSFSDDVSTRRESFRSWYHAPLLQSSPLVASPASPFLS